MMKGQEMLRKVNGERRAATRVSLRQMVANSRVLEAESAGMSRFAAWPISDISCGGICVHSEEKIDKNTLAFLNIDLDAFRRTVSMIAKVVWCRKRAAFKYDVGLAFSYWPDESDKKPLNQFIYNMLAEQEK